MPEPTVPLPQTSAPAPLLGPAWRALLRQEWFLGVSLADRSGVPRSGAGAAHGPLQSGDAGRGVRLAVRRGAGLDHGGGAPRRPAGDPAGRAVRDPDPDAVGGGGRGGQHLGGEPARPRRSDAGARHAVRGDDDPAERHGRPGAAGRRLAASRAAIQSPGRQRLSGPDPAAGGAEPDPARLHPDHAGADRVARADGVPDRDGRRPLPRLSGPAGGAAPRLLHAERRRRAATRDCRPASRRLRSAVMRCSWSSTWRRWSTSPSSWASRSTA